MCIAQLYRVFCSILSLQPNQRARSDLLLVYSTDKFVPHKILIFAKKLCTFGIDIQKLLCCYFNETTSVISRKKFHRSPFYIFKTFVILKICFWSILYSHFTTEMWPPYAVVLKFKYWNPWGWKKQFIYYSMLTNNTVIKKKLNDFIYFLRWICMHSLPIWFLNSKYSFSPWIQFFTLSW